MYAVVTLNIVVWTRYWTSVNWFFYIFLSIFVYIGYLWISNFVELGTVTHSVATTHASPMFWLTILLTAGMTFLGDYSIEYRRL